MRAQRLVLLGLVLITAGGCDVTEPNDLDRRYRSEASSLSENQFALDPSIYSENQNLRESGWTARAHEVGGNLRTWLARSAPGVLTEKAIVLLDPPTAGEIVSLAWDGSPVLTAPVEILTRLWIEPGSQKGRIGIAWFVDDAPSGRFLGYGVVRQQIGPGNGFGIVRYVNQGSGIWNGTGNDGLENAGWVWIRVQHTIGDIQGTIRFRAWAGSLEDEPAVWHAEETSTWFGPHGGTHGPHLSGRAGPLFGSQADAASAFAAWDVLTIGVAGEPAPPPPGVVGPALSCTEALRGGWARCTVTHAPDSALTWTFSATDTYGLPVDRDSTFVGSVWEGTAVLSGVVSVVVGGDTLSESLSVHDRAWGWGPEQWSFIQGEGQFCTPQVEQRFVIGGSSTLGLNTRRANCDGGAIDPSLFDQTTAPQSITIRAVDQGPNTGLFYVDSAYFRMDRGSVMNPEVTANGVKYGVSGQDASICRKALGLQGNAPVQVNMFEYNELCRNVPLAGFHQGIWAHEGFGTRDPNDPAQANGHQARKQIAAGQIQNDPYVVAQPIVAQDSTSVLARVRNDMSPVEVRISNFSINHTFVKDNWCGSLWVWNPQTSRYVLTPIITVDGNCL